MGLFNPKPTLETRLTTAETSLSTLLDKLGTAFELSAEDSQALAGGDLGVLDRVVTGFQTRLTESDAATTKAVNSATDLQTRLTAATDGNTALRASLQSALQLTDAQFTALAGGDLTVVATAVTGLAQRRAVDLAAGQHVPPVITSPSATGDPEDEVALAYQAANAEKDPRKRGELFARASRLVFAKQQKTGSN